MIKKPKLLITGSGGLLGYEFILNYRHDYDLYAITHSLNVERLSDVNYIQIDFSQNWDITLLPKELDFVIHLAQSPRFRDFPNAAMEVFNVNLLSTMRLLDYSKKAGVKKFVLASTGGIYGSSASPISVNSEILSPTGLGHYFGSKLSAEIFANNYREFFAVDINRIFFMYGPRQSKAMLIPRLIDSVKNGLPVQLAGDDGISINPVYVQDVADFLNIQICDLDSHVYNIAGPEIVSIRQLTELISGKFGGSASFELLPKSANIVADATAFLDKLKNSPTKVSEGLNQF